jgi:hypothetical protein
VAAAWRGLGAICQPLLAQPLTKILDKPQDRLKIPPIRQAALRYGAMVRIMNSNSPIANQSSQQKAMEKVCRHPRVRVVAREEDVEFVECQECGDVFEASEFKDMAIEENIKPEEV